MAENKGNVGIRTRQRATQKIGTVPIFWRTGIAAAVGLAGAAAIWLATPYNNFLLNNSNVSDGYLPAIWLFAALVLALVVNPLLRWVWPTLSLTRGQLALAGGIMLLACVLPGQGLLRMLPYATARVAPNVNANPRMARVYDTLGLPAGLWPDELAVGQSAPASEQFLGELAEGESVPWRSWLGPLLTWGVLAGFGWLMMVGLGSVLFEQWRRRERLAFPLLAVQQSLLEPPAAGRLLGPLFRSRGFWIAAAAVFALHLLNGLALYWPNRIPAIPIRWNVREMFDAPIWRSAPIYFTSGQVYFVFVGVAFFMPRRISFSLWFWLFAYGLYRTWATPLGWQFAVPKSDSHRFGAMLAIGLVVLLLSRRRWAEVFSAVVRRGGRRDAAAARDRSAGLMFLAGLTGVFAWFCWAGCEPAWSAALTAFALLAAVVISRVVAETGLPFIRLYEDPTVLMRLAPAGWYAPGSIYMAVVANLFFGATTRVSAAALTTHALGMDGSAGPARQRQTARTLLAVLLVGLVACGGVHLWMNYHHATTLDASHRSPLSDFGVGAFLDAGSAAADRMEGRQDRPPFNQAGHIAFGAGLAGSLYAACLAWPTFPVHPVGILLVDGFFGHTAFASLFIGWLLTVLIVRLGGARLYRAARGVFIGLIVGEVFAAVFWAAVPAVLAAMGRPFTVVRVLP